MSKKRKIEIFSAGCPLCKDALSLVKQSACPDCEINVLDMRKPSIAKKAREIGIHYVPSVVIDGRITDCCGQGLNEKSLKAAGLGHALKH